MSQRTRPLSADKLYVKDEMLETALRAAREAGRILVERYQRPHDVRSKGFRDITTEADFAAEKAALDIIRQGCPDAQFVSEESFATHVPDPLAPAWYVDPLDGTTNFARGLPTFSVSVAMARHGQIQVGAVYDPLLDQLFYAERGQGAYLNDARLRVSDRAGLIQSLILLDWPRAQEPRRLAVDFLTRLAPQVDAIRSRGSAALAFCSVAAGWVEAYFQYTLGPWDAAAGWLILEEAGGKVTDLRGQPPDLTKPDWLATNGPVHAALLAARPFG